MTQEDAVELIREMKIDFEKQITELKAAIQSLQSVMETESNSAPKSGRDMSSSRPRDSSQLTRSDVLKMIQKELRRGRENGVIGEGPSYMQPQNADRLARTMWGSLATELKVKGQK